MAKRFKDLSEREILALAISLEEEDGRVYADFADGLSGTVSCHRQSLRRDGGGRNLSIARA